MSRFSLLQPSSDPQLMFISNPGFPSLNTQPPQIQVVVTSDSESEPTLDPATAPSFTRSIIAGFKLYVSVFFS